MTAFPPARRSLHLRAHLGTVAGAVILGVLLWRLGTGVFLDGLRRIDAPTLLAGLGIGVLTTVFSAWRWCRVAGALGIRLPLGVAVADYYRALFLNAALPGGVLGDVHRAMRHGRSAGDVGRGVRAVVLERTAGQAALVVVGIPVLLTLPSPVLTRTRHFVALLALAALGALAVVTAVRKGRTAGRPRRRRAFDAARSEVYNALLTRRSWPVVLFSSLVVLAGHLLMFLVAARAAGAHASPATLLPLALLALIAMGLPLSIGGWGPREGITAWAFGAAGLGTDTGVGVAVVYGLLSFTASLPGMLVLLARWHTGLRRPGTKTGTAASRSVRALRTRGSRYVADHLVSGDQGEVRLEGVGERREQSLSLLRGSERRTSDDTGLRIGRHAEGEQMPSVVGEEVRPLVSGPDPFGMAVQKDGGLDLPGVHVTEQRSAHTGPFPGRFPVLRGREERHPHTAAGGLLDDIAEDVVPAVTVDQHEGLDARAAQRRGDVPYHRMEGDGGDAHGSRPRRMLVRAGDRHRREEVNRIHGGDLAGDRAGDQCVGGQRKVRTVLLETAHGKDGDLTEGARRPRPYVL
jgi:uncharacterized membrane protein YbhN (UPF0104 family)